MAERPSRWRSALRRHERLLAWLTLAAPLALIGLLVLMGVLEARGKVWFFGRAESLLQRWDDRWLARVETGERLLGEGRYDEAARYLERLDRRFPARTAEHKRDKERERLLRALAGSEAALDRKGRTLDAYRRLVAFDPRNYANHYDLAAACLRFNETEEARRHLERALAIFPTHLDSLRAYVELLWDRSDYPGVVRIYETYRDALTIRPVRLVAGDYDDERPLSIDGEIHELRFRTGAIGVPPDRVRLEPGEARVQLESIRVEPRGRVGEPWPDPVELEPELAFDWPAELAPAAVVVRLRARKPLDEELGGMVAKAYENVLRPERAREVRRLAALGAAG